MTFFNREKKLNFLLGFSHSNFKLETMRMILALFLSILGGAFGHNQLYYGYYFGCRLDFTLCIQLEVLPDSSMRIEAFSDSVSLYGPNSGGDRVVHYFPSVRYSWDGAWMKLEERAFGLRYRLQFDKSQLTTKPSDIALPALGRRKYVGAANVEETLSAQYLKPKQIRMLGVDLDFDFKPVAWDEVVEDCRETNGWKFVTGNLKILSQLDATFWKIYNLQKKPRYFH